MRDISNIHILLKKRQQKENIVKRINPCYRYGKIYCDNDCPFNNQRCFNKKGHELSDCRKAKK